MALTKLGQSYLLKEAGTHDALINMLLQTHNATKYIAQKGYAGAKGVTTKVLPSVYNKIKPLLAVSADAANAVASSAVRNPKVVIPALGVTAIGAYALPKNMKKYYLHADPSMHATIAKAKPPFRYAPGPGILTDITYRSPEAKNYFANKNIYY